MPASESDLSYHQFQSYTTRQYGRHTGYTPTLLLPERGKEPVTSKVAHLVQRAVDDLLEALVVADLRDERVRVDVHGDAPVGVLKPVDLAVLRGEQRECAQWQLLVDERDIAQEGHRRRDGDRCGCGCGHCCDDEGTRRSGREVI